MLGKVGVNQELLTKPMYWESYKVYIAVKMLLLLIFLFIFPTKVGLLKIFYEKNKKNAQLSLPTRYDI